MATASTFGLSIIMYKGHSTSDSAHDDNPTIGSWAILRAAKAARTLSREIAEHCALDARHQAFRLGFPVLPGDVDDTLDDRGDVADGGLH